MKKVQAYTACLVLLLCRKRRALVLTGVRKQSLHGTVIPAVLHRLAVAATQRPYRCCDCRCGFTVRYQRMVGVC